MSHAVQSLEVAGRLTYDRAFEPAVRNGTLTVRQAIERGRRDHYVHRLSVRHGLSWELADAVADGRLPILDALRENRETPKSETVEEIVDDRRSVPWGLMVFGCLIVAFVGVRLWASELPFLTGPSNDVRTPVESAVSANEDPAVVETNRDGRATRVVGATPEAVLEAYCDVRSNRRALGVVDAIPHNPRGRFAVFEDVRSGKTYALHVRHDLRTRRWVAGNGRSPIEAAPTP